QRRPPELPAMAQEPHRLAPGRLDNAYLRTRIVRLALAEQFVLPDRVVADADEEVPFRCLSVDLSDERYVALGSGAHAVRLNFAFFERGHRVPETGAPAPARHGHLVTELAVIVRDAGDYLH